MPARVRRSVKLSYPQIFNIRVGYVTSQMRAQVNHEPQAISHKLSTANLESSPTVNLMATEKQLTVCRNNLTGNL